MAKGRWEMKMDWFKGIPLSLPALLPVLLMHCNVTKEMVLPQIILASRFISGVRTSIPAPSAALNPPVFSPAQGTYSSAQSVSVSSGNTGVILCYTADGTLPACDKTPKCTNGTLYSSPISVNASVVLKAVACSADTQSSVTSGNYILTDLCAARTVSPYSSAWNAVSMTGIPNSGIINYNEMFKHFGYSCKSDQIMIMPQDAAGLHTWLLNLSNHAWSEIFPSMPSTRIRYTMSDDPVRNRTMLFGGCSAGCAGGFTDELWAFDHTAGSWSLITSGGPSARWGMILAYDSLRDRFIAFGGSGNAACSPALNDTWAYDPNLNSWTNLSPATPPTGRCFGTEFVYDISGDRFVLHGGYTNNGGTEYSDTCIYNPAGNSWSCSTPGSSPTTSQLGQIVFVDVIGSPIRWGGYTGGADSNEFHRINSLSSVYTVMSQTSAPSARNGHGIIYDKRRNRLLLYGGRDGASACTGPPAGICLDMHELKF